MLDLRRPVRPWLCKAGALAVLGAIFWSAPNVAAAATSRSVKFDLAKGRVGGLELGSASATQVTKRFGKPKRQYTDVPGADAGTRRLVYSCGANCKLEAQLDAGNVLQLAWAYSQQGKKYRRIRTRAGTYLGMSQASAERREDALMTSGCITQLVRSAGSNRLEVATGSGQRVDSIVMATSDAFVLC